MDGALKRAAHDQLFDPRRRHQFKPFAIVVIPALLSIGQRFADEIGASLLHEYGIRHHQWTDSVGLPVLGGATFARQRAVQDCARLGLRVQRINKAKEKK